MVCVCYDDFGHVINGIEVALDLFFFGSTKFKNVSPPTQEHLPTPLLND